MSSTRKLCIVQNTKLQYVIVQSSSYVARCSLNDLQGSYTRTLRTLMWLVASTFIIPDILSLVQIIIIALGKRSNIDLYMFVLFFINPCIEIIGMLFSTAWAAKNHWRAHDVHSQMPTISLHLTVGESDKHAKAGAGAVPEAYNGLGARADTGYVNARRDTQSSVVNAGVVAPW